MSNEGGQETRASGIGSPEGRAARSRPVWGIVLGALMVLAGLVVLGHVLLATVVSVIFLGWFAVLGGLAGIVASLFHLGKPGFWPTLLGGALALVVGIAFLRRPGQGAAALTLLLGSVLLVGGVTRIVGGIGERHESRVWIIANGVITLLLGLLILFGWPGSTLWVLGTFLGVDLIVEGVTFIGLGFPRRGARPATT
jgi:uncharacterized membrane protein HdeD (DUF308 family)